jgi:hypothetical protein
MDRALAVRLVLIELRSERAPEAIRARAEGAQAAQPHLQRKEALRARAPAPASNHLPHQEPGGNLTRAWVKIVVGKRSRQAAKPAPGDGICLFYHPSSVKSRNLARLVAMYYSGAAVSRSGVPNRSRGSVCSPIRERKKCLPSACAHMIDPQDRANT